MAFSAKAQKACFRLLTPQGSQSDTVGCAPFSVQVKSCTTYSNVSSYIVYFKGFGLKPNGSAPLDSGIRYTYTQPGTYRINMLISSNGSGNVLSDSGREDTLGRFIHVIEPETAQVKLEPCNNRRLKLVITKKPYERFIIDYNDGSGKLDTTAQTGMGTQLTLFKQYPLTGTLKATVTIKPLYCGATVTDSVTLIEKFAPPDSIILKPLGNNLQINIARALILDYRFRIIKGNQALADTIPYRKLGPGQYQLLGLNANDPQLCIQVQTKDPCGFGLGAGFLDSATVCNLVLNRNQSSPDRIKMSWAVFGPSDTTLLIRNATTLAVFSDSIQVFTDSLLRCDHIFNYSLLSSYTTKAGGKPVIVSLSNSISIIPSVTRKPPAVKSTLATIGKKNKVKLYWQAPDGIAAQEYFIYRTNPPDTFKTIFHSGKPYLEDPNSGLPAQGVCYRIAYQDSCGNIGYTSNQVCPILLNAKPAPAGNAQYYVSFAPYQPKPDTIVYRYRLEFLDPDMNVLRYQDLPKNLYSLTETGPFPETQVIRWRIKLLNGNNPDSLPIYSNIVEIVQPANISFPDVFTPNADGINDTYRVYGKYIQDFDMQIFNRWGQLVFHSTKIDAEWDGFFNGVPSPLDIYVCVIAATDQAGEKYNFRTTFAIAR